MQSDERSGWGWRVTSFRPGNDHKSLGKGQIIAEKSGTDRGKGGRATLSSRVNEDSGFSGSDLDAVQPINVAALTGQAALIIGHPGHELCVYGWCGLARPSVFILTDGSGRTEVSRTARSLTILERLGCTTGPGTGLFTDREVYRALLSRDHKLFGMLARQIAEWLILDDIDLVVGDAAEGFNPVHDVCRLIINAAVEMAAEAQNRPISNFAFRLDWRKEREYTRAPEGARTLILDQVTFDSKLSAAWDYDELRSDIEAVLSDNGAESFRTEKFDPIMVDGMVDGTVDGVVDKDVGQDHQRSSIPYYEEYGARLMSEGIYNQVIRYDEHLAPLADALSLAVQEGM